MKLTSEVLAVDVFWLALTTLPLMLNDPGERSKALEICSGIGRLTLMALALALALDELEAIDN